MQSMELKSIMKTPYQLARLAVNSVSLQSAECRLKLRFLASTQFSALLGAGLLRDLLSLYDTDARQFHATVALGDSVCGHRRETAWHLVCGECLQRVGTANLSSAGQLLLGPDPGFSFVSPLSHWSAHPVAWACEVALPYSAGSQWFSHANAWHIAHRRPLQTWVCVRNIMLMHMPAGASYTAA